MLPSRYSRSQLLLRYLSLGVILLVGLGLVCWPTPALAEGGPGNLWQTYTVNDGLLSGDVLAVFLAQDGTLWFGTDAGASHYDGHWESWTVNDGLPAGRVRAIAQTEDGALWFATETGGLGQCDVQTKDCRAWTVDDGLPSNDVRALLPDGTGRLWIGTSAGLVYLQDGHLVKVDDLAGTSIWAIASGPQGMLWASTEGHGVWEHTGDGTWRVLDGSDLVQGAVYALWTANDGRVWAGTPNGLIYYSDGTWQRQPLQENDSGLRVFSIVPDHDGGFWVGTDQGCFHDTDAQPSETPLPHLTARNGLVNDFVRAMAFDGDGALWMGTIAGVSRYAGNIWQVIDDASLKDQRINTILTDNAGQTWVGTERNGLAVWNGEQWQHITQQEGLVGDRVITLFEDDQGRVWVGTGNGVSYQDVGGKWHSFGRSAGLVGVPVYSIDQDVDGNIWLATENGVSRWNETSGFQTVPELAGQRVSAVHRGRDGALWFGADKDGLVRFAANQSQQNAAAWQVVNAPAGASFRQIVANGIVEKPDGTLWVGTYSDGLWQYQGGQWQRIDGALASPLVLTVRYADSSLWVGTRVGFDRHDDRTWQAYVGDALPSSEVLAITLGKEGVVWIGTKAGLVRYRPESRHPWLRIAAINSLAPVDGGVKLLSNRLQTVRLVGGDLSTRPEYLQFITQLDGVDQSLRVQSGGMVSYANLQLKSGIYLLHAWVRDAAFNYSVPGEVKIIVPKVVTLPGGRTVPADVFYPGVALGVLALGGLTAAGGVSWRARARERQQASARATRQHEALERHFNPYISGEPVRQPDMFFGRDELLRKIINALHHNSIMIHGERRMGKTTLLFQLGQALRQADDPEWVFIPVLVDLEGTSQERFFHLLMEDIWGVLQAYLAENLEELPELRFTATPVTEYTDRDFTADLKVLLGVLKKVVAPRQVRVVLLMDEMDVINAYDSIVQQQLRRIFMSPLAHNLGAVVAGIQISKAWDRVESPWYNLFNEIPLEPFSDEQARELLVEPVRGVYEWNPDAIEFVISHAEGRPYRLQQYALEAVNHMLADKRLRITMADVEAADEAIERASVT